MALAAVIHRRRRRAALQLEGKNPEAHRDEWEACECGCSSECEHCGGRGLVRRESPGEAELLEAHGEFLLARAFIERHGLGAYEQRHGEASGALLEGLDVLDAELQRLELEDAGKAARKG